MFSGDIAHNLSPQKTDFIYQPLNMEEDSIRLLKYTKQAPGSGPAWSLHTTFLSESVPFIALSYVWGKPESTATFCLSDTAVTISGNLADALKNLTIILEKSGEPRLRALEYVWADALCINQNDDDEKSHQVQIMSKIYARANITVGWLGKGPPKSENALRSLAIIVESMSLPRQTVTMPFHRSASVRQCTFDQIRELVTKEVLISDTLRHILQNPFWQRVWILQETAIPKELVYAYGCEIVDWTVLFTIAYILEEFRFTVKPIPHTNMYTLVHLAKQPLQMLWRRAKVSGIQQPDKFIELLPKVRARFLATDPRDLIYALLGVARGLNLQADYSISVRSLYIKLAESIIQSDWNERLDLILDQAQRLQESEDTLPSWVPDWRVPGPSLLNETKGFNIREKQLVGMRLPLSGPEKSLLGLDSSVKGEVLCLEGYQIDTVKLVHADSFADMDGPNALAIWVMHFESMLKSTHSKYLDDAERFLTAYSVAIASSRVPGVKSDWIFTGGYSQDRRQTQIYQMNPIAKRWEDISDEIVLEMKRLAIGRKVFTTETGYIGLGPRSTNPGDMICVVEADMPIVLSKADNKGLRYLGQAYLYGVMFGRIGKSVVSNLEKQIFEV